MQPLIRSAINPIKVSYKIRKLEQFENQIRTSI